ncbi:hypothetical protein [Siphonobacter sp. SORGH_AS_1065]|uniref:hypothetical protein n=1 Tax=Siphonobacter sp. SORGH_AS_1065 TaxID=3041795 RepID=UPI0027815D1A|nr:hypothetical protein [Siphonobacter sp. SORGH_AS_1065]MDQ1086181.1 hypothetical protein [Siphonobacter sp. SORGH_AS_1065]
MFKRRIGIDPHAEGGGSATSENCPDIWELEDGSFAIIGKKRTIDLKSHLPKSASCGADEEIVVIPRVTLLAAKKDIPNE